ncbi:endonuclease VII domain-containing protein [Streptomyces sp. NBC_00269]|uniref:endonuclease domain-containing protein n=1 Tax=Streptomyces sp. NBC_00269 TaxID=2975696 RepID=UPI002E2E312F|nr:endonuclease domain-containing protein [Streptomyces sp. NBC_00269]
MECIYEGCGREQYGQGLCPGHLTQKKRGKELKPLRKYNRWSGEKKECPGCGEEKDGDEYLTDKSRASGLTQYCRECQRWRNIQWSYSLSRDEWEYIFQAQGSCCAICGTDKPGTSLGFVTDHDHACCPGKKSCGDCIRGITCQQCNFNVDRSQKPRYVAYREVHATRTQPLKEAARMGLTA